jgi:hypothetical protein
MNSAKPLGSVLCAAGSGTVATRNAPVAAAIADDNPITACLISASCPIFLMPLAPMMGAGPSIRHHKAVEKKRKLTKAVP